jgi:PEP-CTERM motif
MRRLVYFLILVLVVGVSATGVSASTDCERWFAEYHSELVHSQQVQRLAAAKRRAKRYAMRKLAGYVKPAPKPNLTPVHHIPRGPRMSPHDALHKVELACGILPEETGSQPLLSEEEPAEFIPDLTPADEVGLLPGFDGPGTLLPEESVPTAPVFSEAPPGAPGIPGGGAPIYTPPFTTPPHTSTVAPPPPPVVPEPSSFVLLLTGFAGAAGVVRRRFKI